MRSFVFVLFVIVSTLLSQAQRSYADCAKCHQKDPPHRAGCFHENNCPMNGKRFWNQDLWQLEKRNKPISIEEILRRLIE